MKRAILILALLAALPLTAQEATLDVPQVVTASKLVVAGFCDDGDTIRVRVELRTAAGVVTKSAELITVRQAERTSLWTAVGTTRAGETGTVERRKNFRILGWCKDNAKFRAEDNTIINVTLVP